jgi:hypothetical protein
LTAEPEEERGSIDAVSWERKRFWWLVMWWVLVVVTAGLFIASFVSITQSLTLYLVLLAYAIGGEALAISARKRYVAYRDQTPEDAAAREKTVKLRGELPLLVARCMTAISALGLKIREMRLTDDSADLGAVSQSGERLTINLQRDEACVQLMIRSQAVPSGTSTARNAKNIGNFLERFAGIHFFAPVPILLPTRRSRSGGAKDTSSTDEGAEQFFDATATVENGSTAVFVDGLFDADQRVMVKVEPKDEPSTDAAPVKRLLRASREGELSGKLALSGHAKTWKVTARWTTGDKVGHRASVPVSPEAETSASPVVGRG